MALVNAPISPVGLLLLGGLLALAAPATAEDSPLPPQQELLRAEELYRQGQLAAAERAYLRALPATTGARRRLCYDRLLAIYARVGRSDQAIRIALEYEPWARRQEDFDRVRELNLALGKWYLALGHGKEAEKHLRRVLADPKRPLPPGTKVTALTYLALAADRQGDQGQASKYWAEVAEVARTRADDPRRDLGPRERIDWACRLAESCRFRGRPEEALARLERILPLYDRLDDRAGKRDTLQLLATLGEKVLGPKKLLLVYYVGREGSYLLLLGGGMAAAEAFPLRVPSSVAERAASPARGAAGKALAGVRGLVLERRVVQPEMPAAPPKEERAVPLTPPVLRALVESYLEQEANPHFQPTRGLRLPSRAAGRPLPAQRPELLGDVLLPARARARIRALRPKEIVIIPDGALHKLPFEALLLQAGSKPVYVLDELPPLSYAPSVAILDLLARRPPAGDGPLSLLTVADPAYPQTDAGGRWQGGLPRLRYSARESQQIARLFAAGRVTELRGKQATKQALLRALPGKRIVHLAAHGFADNRFGNLFGALALTPPPAGRETPEDDGFLSLHEVCALPLRDCELAVLSACVTNVGPRRPLEAGVTLAGAFLAAGARRVVASHWSVADRSTAVLMEVFFEEVTAAYRHGRSLVYAEALRQARLHVRNQPRWSSPFYWAPFVLVGPAQ